MAKYSMASFRVHCAMVRVLHYEARHISTSVHGEEEKCTEKELLRTMDCVIKVTSATVSEPAKGIFNMVSSSNTRENL